MAHKDSERTQRLPALKRVLDRTDSAPALPPVPSRADRAKALKAAAEVIRTRGRP